MKLFAINVQNYKSIRSVKLDIQEVTKSHTFTLIGINESGKSNFLKAISLIDANEQIDYPEDYHDKTEPVRISLIYSIDGDEEKNLKKTLRDKGFPTAIINLISINSVEIGISFEPILGANPIAFENISFHKKEFPEYTFINALPVKKDPSQIQEDYDLEKYFKRELPEYFYDISHNIVFWKYDSRHLINESIDLISFAANPLSVSIPLANCFALAKIENITNAIMILKSNPSEISNLQERLGDAVTKHVNEVWPDHPIKIKFIIDGSLLSFLVEDNNVRYESRNIDQRSDGFKQFLSFLLTTSAEHANKQLSNTLLLLDEPETHLHPQAQEHLMQDLIKLTNDGSSNLVFFATHSNNMIDKKNLNRCFRVIKRKNKYTELERIEGQITSYSEVNFEVFGIASSDYHNELYGYIELNGSDILEALDKPHKWKNTKTKKTSNVSLATYIRHSIHHPENGTNRPYTSKELLISIEQLRDIRSEIKKSLTAES